MVALPSLRAVSTLAPCGKGSVGLALSTPVWFSSLASFLGASCPALKLPECPAGRARPCPAAQHGRRRALTQAWDSALVGQELGARG